MTPFSFFTLPEISEPLFFFPPFSAMPLPQLLKKKKFYSPISAMALPQLGAHIFFFLPISEMPLPQLVCHNFFFSLFRQWHCHNSFVKIFFFFLFTSGTLRTGSRTGQRKFGITVAEIQHFLTSSFSSSLSYFWLNFGNGDTEIQSLSSKSQITFNSSYNAN